MLTWRKHSLKVALSLSLSLRVLLSWGVVGRRDLAARLDKNFCLVEGWRVGVCRGHVFYPSRTLVVDKIINLPIAVYISSCNEIDAPLQTTM